MATLLEDHRIRPLRADDLAAALALSEAAGWNQTPADWRRLLAWEPAGCFALEAAGALRGTVTTTRYGAALGWIGMLLVDEGWRRRGYGRWLLTHALEWLDGRGVRAAMLDATPLGKPLYEALGFREQAALDRWQGIASSAPDQPGAVLLAPDQPFTPSLLALDRAAFGVDRARVLTDLLAAPGAFGFRVGGAAAPDGYVLARPGAHRWHAGPLVARDAASAWALLAAALGHLAGQPVQLDAPRTPDAQALAGRAGLAPVRPFSRMLRGGPPPPADLALTFATAAPEIG